LVLSDDCGIFADTPSEWGDSLRKLIADEKLRRRLGTNGRERAVNNYSLEVHAPRLITLFKELAEQRNRVPSTRR
jgi:glycosyltransferase involved in cell wall biosynthesis